MEQSVKKSFFGTDIPEGYNLIVEISETDKDFDLAKNIDITVYYNIFGKSYFRNMETLIEREKIEEVNEPIINNDYFKFLNIDVDDYDIIPIKYSKDLNSYIVTTFGDSEWYNYLSSDPIWANAMLSDGKYKVGEVAVGQVVQNNNSTIEQTEINQDGIISLEKTASYEEYNSGNKRKVIIKEQIITNNKDNIPQTKINTIKL